MSENDYTAPDSQVENSDSSTAVPSEYDKQQDRSNAEKDVQIAELQSKLDALQSAAPDQVSSVPPVLGGSPSGASGPGDVPESAQFHEVLPPSSDSGSDDGDTLGSLKLGEVPTVNVDPSPELSDSQNVKSDSEVRTQDDLKEAVAEILTMVREIHETVAWVKSESPKIAAALSDSPFGKLLPSFLGNL